jgi:hypothetical protein
LHDLAILHEIEPALASLAHELNRGSGEVNIRHGFDVDLPPRCWYAHELTGMCASPTVSGRNPALLRKLDEVLYLPVTVWECSSHDFDLFFDPFDAITMLRSWHGVFVDFVVIYVRANDSARSPHLWTIRTDRSPFEMISSAMASSPELRKSISLS